MDSPELAGLKAEMRVAAIARRERAFAADPKAGEVLARVFLANISIPGGAVVSAYWPLPGEMDARPLMLALHERGHPLGLPVVIARGQPLRFRRWLPGIALVPGNFKVLAPPAEAPEVVPDVLLVPLLAFDRRGHRLGYGGGFYDRTLAARKAAGRALAIGIGYAAQEVGELPAGAFDHLLDAIATERDFLTFGGQGGM